MSTPQQRDLLTSIPAAPTTPESVPFSPPADQLEAEMWLIARLAQQHVSADVASQRLYVAEFFAGTTTIAHRGLRVRKALIEHGCASTLCGRFDPKGPVLTYEDMFQKLYGTPLESKTRRLRET